VGEGGERTVVGGRVGGVGSVECELTLGVELLSGTEVRRGRGMDPDPGMSMFVIICQEYACVVQRAEPVGKSGTYFIVSNRVSE